MKISTFCIAVLIGFAGVTSANAGVIVAPVSGSTTIPVNPRGGGDLENVFNQSGLSKAYVAGVTDFDAFVANTHDSSNGNNTWNGAATSGNIIFDLGGLKTLESVAIWNRDFAASGVANFNLVFSKTADFAVSTAVNGLTLADIAAGGSSASTLAQVFAFAAVEAAFVRMEILSSFDASSLTFGEIVFEQSVSDVPLPAALPLLLMGLAGLGFAGRSKKNA